MYEILGEHRQDFNEVRRLCLICHGLDLTSDKLFNNSTYNNKLRATNEIYRSLVSSALLNLAVTIRINIYQGKLKTPSNLGLAHCGLYYDDEELICKHFTIKDVCDKIIHADSISKGALPPEVVGDSKMTIQLKGTHKDRGWTLDLSLELFAEAVLNYIDELEKNDA